jgi:hypothetical protein
MAPASVSTYVNPERRPVHAWSERGRLQGHCISFTSFVHGPYVRESKVKTWTDLYPLSIYVTVGLLWVDLYLARANP